VDVTGFFGHERRCNDRQVGNAAEEEVGVREICRWFRHLESSGGKPAEL